MYVYLFECAGVCERVAKVMLQFFALMDVLQLKLEFFIHPDSVNSLPAGYPSIRQISANTRYIGFYAAIYPQTHCHY